MNRKSRLSAMAATIVCAGVVVAAALATYPGTNNGRIAFAMRVNGNVDIYSAMPNGNDLRPA
jgi:hypothetical protein